ncbi:Sli15p LALA0_S04e04280g [Lachancea lanzarotensis]|uniref:LALA0S04e04280g1_1 n=1 Tax=Lachancea lanzarotensis TaxID=1245769 RepID=A0A0C7N5W5_9SACH|nr:uncharacterized protein LALA0_S04e04280g [Lachancea lanzarotensis]CEP61948.1 LALA0S04e04280g1_1 [Lachancea lanzarotensis]
MDWAVKSARKKTRFIQGGSRSIVESLNRFNEVLTEGQDAISQACLASSKWLDDELLKIGLLSKQETIPEESKEALERNKLALEESTPQKAARRESWHATPGNKSEKSEEHVLAQPDKDGSKLHKDDEKNAILGDVDTSSKTRSRSLKSSPWSPYKSERTTFAPEYAPPQTSSKIAGSFGSHSGNNSSGQEANEPKNNHSPNGSNTPTVGEIRTTRLPLATRRSSLLERNTTRKIQPLTTEKTERLPLRDRSKRRTDMFIPLPDKDPLIIRSSINPQAKTQDLSSSTIPRNDTALKHASSNVISRHDRPPMKTVKPVYSNVFDRLTSTSTTSFDKKATSRSPTREIKRPKLVEMAHMEPSGSPREKKSPRIDHTNHSIHETLRNIFDSQIPKLGQMNNASNSNGLTRNSTNAKRSSLLPKLSGQTAVSPISMTANAAHRISGIHSNGLETSPTFSSVRSRPPKSEQLKERNRTIVGLLHDPHVSPRQKKLPRRESSTTEFLESVSARRNDEKLLANQPEEDLDRLERSSIKSLPQEHHDIREIKDSRPKQAQDRLTKFQLLPLVGSERQDVKKKLDKRLSEVIRSQKEQSKRSQEKLKRKSNIEEDVKQRKSRIFQDSDPNRGTKSFCAGADGAESSNNKPRNTILYDLNTTDHRQMINGNSEETNTETNAGDTTLPEIDSDSDAEDRSILAAWAHSPYLQEQLLAQQDWDPESIFGPIPPLHTDEVFQSSRLSKLKTRQSISRHNIGL